jgi:hypothetical protein
MGVLELRMVGVRRVCCSASHNMYVHTYRHLLHAQHTAYRERERDIHAHTQEVAGRWTSVGRPLSKNMTRETREVSQVQPTNLKK